MIPPEFYAELKHNKLRRADFHDYFAPCFYLITFVKNPSPEVPLFSTLVNNGLVISTDFSWSGWAIYNGINSFAKDFPFIRVWRYVIMPDHVHIILYVTIRTELHLGKYVGYLKTACTQALHKKAMIRNHTNEPIFEAGFNDRILFAKQENQLDIWTNYVLDNPRRLWLMRSTPEFFSKTSIVNSDKFPSQLWLPEHKPLIQLYGNRLLLQYPELCVVKFSHKFSAGEWQKKRREALRVAKNGGVLVSPFIHKEEKAIFEEGLLLGAKVIKVIYDGFLDRAKPQGADFYHCAEGRMLLAAMNSGVYTATRINRDLCRRMNGLAIWIAGNPEELLR